MVERGQAPRWRSYLGATIVFNAGWSTLNCIVQDYTTFGARLTFPSCVTLPETFRLLARHHALDAPVFIKWRDTTQLGVAFCNGSSDTKGHVIPFRLARRLHDLEARNAPLRERIAELGG